eukprot:Clim_evm97s88 gene=Clim_evmTU97s88
MKVLAILRAFLAMAMVYMATANTIVHVKTRYPKCLREIVKKDVAVKGDFTIIQSEGPPQTLNFKVMDESESIVFQRSEASSGKFAFTADKEAIYSICLEPVVDSGAAASYDSGVDVELSLMQGAEAKDYDKIAKQNDLRPIERVVRKIEDVAAGISSDLRYMKDREAALRDTNESTNSRVVWFSIFSILCLASLGAYQVYYLRKFFQQKKLI